MVIIVLKSLVLNVDKPKVIITDCDFALVAAVQRTFPEACNLLCIWHIQKNVHLHCRHYLGDDWNDFISDWTEVIRSKTEDAFKTQWKKLTTKFRNKRNVIRYLEDVWLSRKEQFVTAWADRHMHLGNHATSRVEGGHIVLKNYLQVSTGDLRSVREKLSLAIEHQYHENQALISSEMIRVPHTLQSPFFALVVTKVSSFALEKVLEEYEKAMRASREAPLPPCNGLFTVSMGLPCAHEIKRRLEANQILDLVDINKHWWITLPSFNESRDSLEGLWTALSSHYQNMTCQEQEIVRNQITEMIRQPTMIIQNPCKQQTRGRPPDARNRTTSTKRNQSATNLTVEPGKTRKCGICREPGHNSRTCNRKPSSES